MNLLGRPVLSEASVTVVKALGETGAHVGEVARALRAEKAIPWAAAQLDTQAGHEIVRKAAADDADSAVREFARRTLENPRRRLVLEPTDYRMNGKEGAMTRTTIPWILLALVCGLWTGSTFLATEAPRAPAPVTAASCPLAPDPDDRPVVNRPMRASDAMKRSRRWLKELHDPDDAVLRAETLAKVRGSFTSPDSTTLLTGLRTAWLMGDVEYDRDAFRVLIRPWAGCKDREIRFAALRALSSVRPMASDLELWMAEAETVDRHRGERIAEAVVLNAEGILRGRAADILLELLDGEKNTIKAFVMRGMKDGTQFEDRLLARCMEIVRGASDRDYDSSYFFHFIAPKIDPKSDELVDLILERSDPHTSNLRGLETGLSGAQRVRCASAVLTMAEKSERPYRHFVALANLAGPDDLPRLTAQAAREDLSPQERKAIASVLTTVKDREEKKSR